jgi:multidrug resistance efflux pump
MSSLLKTVVAVAGALLLGLLVGFIVGRMGKGDVEAALEKAKRRTADAEEALKREGEECKEGLAAAKTGKHVLLTKESLLRATVELYANNYGLTSQYLAQARSWLRSAQKGLKKSDAAKAADLYEKIGEAQTLAMRLDPTARLRIDLILTELQRLPGAR